MKQNLFHGIWHYFALLLLFIASCTARFSPGTNLNSTEQAITVKIMETSAGNILVDAENMTLYVFRGDSPGISNCYGSCASLWPPLTSSDGLPPGRGPKVTGALGLIKRDNSSYQVTYNDEPLYTYAGDKKPGDTNGNGLYSFGNYWFVLD